MVTALVFLPGLGNAWVAWDDGINFLENPHYRGLGRAQLRWMFTSLDGHWIPLTWLTLGFDYVVWGMRSGGYHLTSLAFHAANAGLAFATARRLLAAAGRRDPDAAEVGFGAAVAALVWAIHPLRAESVAWVTERRDVVSGFFTLLALLAWLRFCADGGRRWYRWSLAAFAAALMSKAIVVGLPVILLLLDRYPLRRLDRLGVRRAVLEKWPFFAMSAAAGLVAVVAHRHVGAFTPATALDWPGRVAVACYGIVFYVWKTLVPVNLSPLYELPHRVALLAWPWVGAVTAVAVLTLVAVRLRRRRPGIAIGWAIWLVALLPVLGLLHYGPHLAADRNTYLAGLTAAMLIGGAAAAGLARARARYTGTSIPAAVVAVAVSVSLGLGALTLKQVLVWRDSETLWRHAVRVSPSAITHSKVGAVLDEQGKTEEAIVHFRESLRLRPDHTDARNNWGIALARRGRWREAIEQYRAAVALEPNTVEPRLNLADALEKVGRTAEAAEQRGIAERLTPPRR
ncbi:MAG: tetratricopeptide repeat protein [Candidatus Rokuibacteriota bacterium]